MSFFPYKLDVFETLVEVNGGPHQFGHGQPSLVSQLLQFFLLLSVHSYLQPFLFCHSVLIIAEGIDFVKHIRYTANTMEPEGTDSYFFSGEGDEAMKNETIEFTWTESASIEVRDGEWRKAEGTLTRSGTVENGVDTEKAFGILKNRVKQTVIEIVEGRLDVLMALRDEPFPEAFAEDAGADMVGAATAAGLKDVRIEPVITSASPQEEPPPLPTGGREAEPAPGGQLKHIADTDYRTTFRIQSFEVAQTATGDKYLKCYGKAPWKRAWVPAWSDVAELLFGEIKDMDLGVVGPPYDLDAVVQMKDDEWKGKKYIAPDKVIEWEQVR